jgi:2'-5' RNA ligase
MVAALVPGADALVGPFRDELDPTARRGLGAHLTLVYPFVEPAAVTPATVDTLRAAVAPTAPFPCTFGELRWFGARVLWLAPDPVAPFREIADRIRRHVPGLAPEERELVPHLTVGLRRAAPLSALRAAGEALAPRLPLTVRIDRIQLMVRTDTWGVGAEVLLRG